jgi:hypothetical protein
MNMDGETRRSIMGLSYSDENASLASIARRCLEANEMMSAYKKRKARQLNVGAQPNRVLLVNF